MRKIIRVIVLALLLGLCACTATQSESQNAETSQGPTWQEQYDLGVRYLSEGNYEEAILAFTAAIEIDPKRAPAYVGRGDAYAKTDDLTAAKADYWTAIQLDETLAEAYLGLSDVYIRQEGYEKAQEILRQGADRAEGNEEILEKLDRLERDKAQKVEDICFDWVEDRDIEYAVITGVNSAGEVQWTYTTPESVATELTRTQEIGLANGLYYLSAGGTIITLDPDSGAVVWENDEFGGASISFAFNSRGELFLCGYYGPDFFWVDKDGNTIKKIQTVDARYFWPSAIRCYDTFVEIGMRGTPDGYVEQEYIVTVSLDPAAGTDDSAWRQAYLAYIQEEIANPSIGELYDVKFQLIYVDDDDIPELWICFSNIASGSQICIFDGEKVVDMYISEYGNLKYIERSGRFYTEGGRMDEYWDGIYMLKNGRFIETAYGEFGAEDNSNVQFDGNGEPIYQYRWNGRDVTKQEYQRELAAAFDSSAARNIFDSPAYDYYQLQQQLLQ